MSPPARHLRSHITALVTVWLVLPALAAAQPFDLAHALADYKADRLEQAIVAFFDILANDMNPDHRDQAEIYLAESLRKWDLVVPATFYYSDLFKVGHTNRYYLNTVEGLLRAQQTLRDPFWVPTILNEHFDPVGFGELEPEQVAQINYLIGELSYRQRKNRDARMFLEYVAPESGYHGRALYLLGLLAVRAGELGIAYDRFAAAHAVATAAQGADATRLREASRLAMARTAYGLGRFEQAGKDYAAVSGMLAPTAKQEAAWAAFRRGDYPAALAASRAAVAGDPAAVEAQGLVALTHFVNCMWPAAERAASDAIARADSMTAALASYLAKERPPEVIYSHVVGLGQGLMPTALARRVHLHQRFQGLRDLVAKLYVEEYQVASAPLWKGSRLAEDLTTIIRRQRETTDRYAGMYVKRLLEDELQLLQQQKKLAAAIAKEARAAAALWRERNLTAPSGDDLVDACGTTSASPPPQSGKPSQVMLRQDFTFELLASDAPL